MNSTLDLAILDKHIIGRVTPHIYAFSTGTVPSYLKVGDTYRPVATRLAEWRHAFPDLESHFQAPATLGEQQDTYFRDYSVHRYLEAHDHIRLQPEDLDHGVYYSREFFRDATPGDVEQAIEDIRASYEADDARYSLYDAASTLPQTHIYTRSHAEWTLRPNQQQAVDNFQEAVRKGRTNLLMYAVMRFGKSFTSLACAKAMGAKSVVIVSAKADVLTEWKKTTEIPANFAGFRFLTTRELGNDSHAIASTISNGEVPVVFLTLQDLQGNEVKDRHKQVFENSFDLLIIDESHYGARAQSYGQVLRDSGLPDESKKNREKELEDTVDPDEADTLVKTLNAKVRLHLSGTPYRILMGSEFTPDDIVAFVQFSDIVQEQEAWDREHLNDDGVNEWDNPYFGFPQMVRFAFNLNKSSRTKIEQLRSQGISATLSALLEPKSVTKDAKHSAHKQFKHEPEVLDLLRIIDGSQSDPNILSFLDYDKIKEGHMCRHMVMVLPYKASCDAMEALLTQHIEEFKSLSDYVILNISGLTTKKNLSTPEAVKAAIAQAEAEGHKTITLTVNKMLTGSTVEQWDAMLFLKDTSSPQEYDQAIFRLQNQYVRDLEVREGQDAEGDRIIRHCLKPQTLLVDFDPTRMFRMQEQKSLIYNVNTDGHGNDELEDRLREELRISPIITLNSNLIKEVEPTDILQAISNYNADRTITDEVMDLPVDLGLLEDAEFRALIEAQAEIGSRKGLELEPNEGEGDDADVSSTDRDSAGDPENTTDGEGESGSETKKPDQKDNMASLEKKMRTYYQRILFFAMLAQRPVSSLGEIIEVGSLGEHPRILANLSLNLSTLNLFKENLDPFKLSQLDYKIQNISRLTRDTSLTPLERAQVALRKFYRLSDSEVRTPSWLCEEVVNGFPPEALRAAVISNGKLLDIASKLGEFSIALFSYLTGPVVGLRDEEARDAIFAIPTSPVAFEFTRKIFEIAGLNVDHIAEAATTYDLLQFAKNDGIDNGRLSDFLVKHIHFGQTQSYEDENERNSVRFYAVLGNPPYQKDDGGNGRSASPIYPNFVEIANSLSSGYSSLVIPARWFSGGKGLTTFRQKMLNDKHIVRLVDYPNSLEVFEGADIAGGICYFLRGGDESQECETVLKFNGETFQSRRRLNEFDTYIRHPLAVSIVKKVQSRSLSGFLDEMVSARKPFGLATNMKPQTSGDITLRHREGMGPFPRSAITKNAEYIDHWKVMLSYLTAEHAGQPNKQGQYRVLSRVEVLSPGVVCTETYLTAGFFSDEATATRFSQYLKTKLVRFLVLQRAISQHITRDMFNFVPVMDWSREWDDKQLFEFFGLTESECRLVERLIREY